jgi:hypothetical protein
MAWPEKKRWCTMQWDMIKFSDFVASLKWKIMICSKPTYMWHSCLRVDCKINKTVESYSVHLTGTFGTRNYKWHSWFSNYSLLLTTEKQINGIKQIWFQHSLNSVRPSSHFVLIVILRWSTWGTCFHAEWPTAIRLHQETTEKVLALQMLLELML